RRNAMQSVASAAASRAGVECWMAWTAFTLKDEGFHRRRANRNEKSCGCCPGVVAGRGLCLRAGWARRPRRARSRLDDGAGLGETEARQIAAPPGMGAGQEWQSHGQCLRRLSAGQG